MHRQLPFLGTLALACALEPLPTPSSPPEPIAILVPDPDDEPESIDEEAEIRRWSACHPHGVARIEFALRDHSLSSESRAELERLVARWNEPSDDPVLAILISGWRSEDEDAPLDDSRAETVRRALIDAGARPSLLLAAGFGVASVSVPHGDASPYRMVTVAEVCGVCCIL